jgi:hypothetical protein
MLPKYMSFLFYTSDNIFDIKGYALLQTTENAFDVKDIKQRKATLDRIRQDYTGTHVFLREPSDLLMPLPVAAFYLLAGGMVSPYDTNLVGDSYYTVNRAWLAYYRALSAGAYPDRMDSFLKNAPLHDPRLQSVFFDKPFRWDAMTRSICYDTNVQNLVYGPKQTSSNCISTDLPLEN